MCVCIVQYVCVCGCVFICVCAYVYSRVCLEYVCPFVDGTTARGVRLMERSATHTTHSLACVGVQLVCVCVR